MLRGLIDCVFVVRVHAACVICVGVACWAELLEVGVAPAKPRL